MKRIQGRLVRRAFRCIIIGAVLSAMLLSCYAGRGKAFAAQSGCDSAVLRNAAGAYSVAATIKLSGDSSGFSTRVPASIWAMLRTADQGLFAWQKWYFRILAAAALLLLHFISLNYILRQKKSLKKLKQRLYDSEMLFRVVFNQAPVGIAVVKNVKHLEMMNPMFEKLLGRSRHELMQTPWPEITHPEDLGADLEQFEAFQSGALDTYSMEKRYLRPDGSNIWVHMTITGLSTEGSAAEREHLCIISDIDTRKRSELALFESERSKAVLLSHIPGLAYRCLNDEAWTMLFLSEGCFDLTGYQIDSLIQNREKAFKDIICQRYHDELRQKWDAALKQRAPFYAEYEILTASGELKWVMEQGQGIFNDSGEVVALEGIVMDISELKERENRILYMSNHDEMTGLYNRRFFEEEKRRLDRADALPLSMIIGDINGVRLINDAFGHEVGDQLIQEAAKIIARCARGLDIVARTGGGEFSLLLPHTDRETVEGIVLQIERACRESHPAFLGKDNHLSLAIGYGTKEDKSLSIKDAEREAEEYLYKRKMLERKSFHSSVISSILATMAAKSNETEEHTERLAELSSMLGRKLGLSEKQIDELKTFAILHDIGKIGIDDRILNKPGKLTEEEWTIMKKHPDIGYRIAMSSAELESVAEYVVSHHEHWDGNGYPRRLKGEAIPLFSRILSVVDAYDAMTADRVYRKAMPIQAALEEIRRNAGTQFDPKIAHIFIDSIEKDGTTAC